MLSYAARDTVQEHPFSFTNVPKESYTLTDIYKPMFLLQEQIQARILYFREDFV